MKELITLKIQIPHVDIDTNGFKVYTLILTNGTVTFENPIDVSDSNEPLTLTTSVHEDVPTTDYVINTKQIMSQ